MILLTNDDGIDAPGLYELAETLLAFGPVLIVAPEAEKSGAGHAITLRQTIRIGARPPRPGGTERIAVRGTPADAVKFALRHHMKKPPRLVVSGPNTGQNVGLNIQYSGTLGACFEAAVGGVSALAVSSEVQTDGWDWTACRHFARLVLERLLPWEEERRSRFEGDPRRHPETPFVLNLNVPALPLAEIKGLRVTRQGMSGFEERFVAEEHPDGPGHYRIDGDFLAHDPDESYDTVALLAGYASLTALQLDRTDRALTKRLEAEWPGG